MAGGGGKVSAGMKAAAAKQYESSPGKTWFTICALILAYFAKYFCTSFLYVVQNLWRQDQNIARTDLAHMFICGYCFSMVGKRAAGKWCDKYGGKNVQMLSLVFYIPIVMIWSCGNGISDAVGLSNYRFPVYWCMWMFNGFFALGLSWVAIMVCASNWIPASMEGRMMAIVGCAPELGDASARAFLGPIIKHGWPVMVMGYGAAGDWSTVSLSAAVGALVLTLPFFIGVSEAPAGYHEEKKAEEEKKAAAGAEGGLDATLMTLTCTMCGLLYAIRTMFLLYSVTWLSEVYCHSYRPEVDFAVCDQDHMTVGTVATASLLFTFFGMFSVLLCGFAKDELSRQGKKEKRGYILLITSFMLFLTVLVMFWWDLNLGFPLAAFMVGMIGFGDFGPYKTMSGAFAIDIGGKARKGDVSAWMGVASNGSAAIIIIISGFVPAWSDMFKILLVLSVGCCALSVLIIKYDEAKKKAADARELPLTAPFLQVLE